jgi:hypothetical protein
MAITTTQANVVGFDNVPLITAQNGMAVRMIDKTKPIK